MNMEGLNMDIGILNEDGDKILTFKDTHSFHHWVKAQRNTSFSIPVYIRNAHYSHQHIKVTKRALRRLSIDDKEVVEVHLSKASRGRERYYAWVEPKSIRS